MAGEGVACPALEMVRRSKPQLSQNIEPGGTGDPQFGQVEMDMNDLLINPETNLFNHLIQSIAW